MWHDLDIVMVNTLSPWRNHHRIPFGPLRGPLTAISRADAAIIHHTDMTHSRKMNVHPYVNFEGLARFTDDFNGAQLKAVCVEAGMMPLRF
ncbi:26S proteasome regulatory subunit 6A [Tanacetum coccineum]|uniref:tetraacyldisaccharide 4'-kinase n=1 Tax=Tanacetum coccineum TaxID=301880 RepID=A0ABQ5DHK6_9ASTR